MNLPQPPSSAFQLGLLFGLASASVNLGLAFCWRGQIIVDETSLTFAIYQGWIFGQLAMAGAWLVFGRRPVLIRLSASLVLVGLLAWPLAHVGSAITARPFFVAGIYFALNAIWIVGVRVTRGVWISTAHDSSAGVNRSTENVQFSLGSAVAWMTGVCLFFGLARQTGVNSAQLTMMVVYLFPFVFTAFVCGATVCPGGTITWRKFAALAVCPAVAGMVGTVFFPGIRGAAVFAIAAFVELVYIAVAWKLCYLAGYRLQHTAHISSTRALGAQPMRSSPT